MDKSIGKDLEQHLISAAQNPEIYFEQRAYGALEEDYKARFRKSDIVSLIPCEMSGAEFNPEILVDRVMIAVEKDLQKISGYIRVSWEIRFGEDFKTGAASPWRLELCEAMGSELRCKYSLYQGSNNKKQFTALLSKFNIPVAIALGDPKEPIAPFFPSFLFQNDNNLAYRLLVSAEYCDNDIVASAIGYLSEVRAFRQRMLDDLPPQ